MLYLTVNKNSAYLNGIDPAVRRLATTAPLVPTAISVPAGSVLTLGAFYTYLYEINQGSNAIQIDGGNIAVADGQNYTSTPNSITLNSPDYAYFGPADGKVLTGDSTLTYAHNAASGNATKNYSLAIRNETFNGGGRLIECVLLNQTMAGLERLFKYAPGSVQIDENNLGPVADTTVSLGLVGDRVVFKVSGAQVMGRNLTVTYSLSSPALGTLSTVSSVPLNQATTLTVGNTPGTYTLTLTDLDGNTMAQTITVTAVSGNRAPVLGTAISLPVGVVGQPYAYTIPASAFTDPDGDALTDLVTNLPAGLTASGATISGTPTAAGTSTVTVGATDPGNLSVTTTASLQVNPAAANQPPVVATPVSLPSATVNVPYAYTIPASAFTDPEGDTLTCVITGLPAGLTASGLSITGTPTAAGVPTISIRATDTGGLFVDATAPLTVDAVATPTPVVTPAIPANTQLALLLGATATNPALTPTATSGTEGTINWVNVALFAGIVALVVTVGLFIVKAIRNDN